MRSPHIDVRVSLGCFARNLQLLRERVRPAKLCVVVKADAYGHGITELAPVARESGADYLGICTNDDAAAIRGLGLDTPLLRLRVASHRELAGAAQFGVEEMVGCLATAERLGALGTRDNPRRIHLNFDTGMGRSGFLPTQVADALAAIRVPGVEVAGVMTHFANADGETLEFTQSQLERFDNMLAEVQAALPADALIHTHNSAAEARLPNRRRDMVRLGAACFGMRTSTAFQNPKGLEPLMSARTEISDLRELPAGSTIGYGSTYQTSRPSLIAALPVGFGEGYPRALCNRGQVLIRGRRCPVVGRVSLNNTTIDVTELRGEVKVGDEVVLVGKQGEDEITFEEAAERWESVHTEMNLMAGLFNSVNYVP